MIYQLLRVSTKYPQGQDPSGYGKLVLLVFFAVYGIYAICKYIKGKKGHKD